MGKIAIIGSGHGGCTASAYLGKRGHEVHLYDSKAFEANLTAIGKRGGMELTGADTGFGKIDRITTDINEAIAGVQVIMVIVPAFGHIPIAKDIAPFLKKGQIVVLAPGSVFGALEFMNTLHAEGLKEEVIVGETASNYFACRRTGPEKCEIFGIKEFMPLATLPAGECEYAVEKVKEFFPNTVAWPNIVHTSFADLNAVVHPIGALLNTGRIENTRGNYDFYWEGITEGVGRAMQAIDDEKIAVAKAMGFKVESQIQLLHEFYGHPERETLYSFFSQSEVNGGKGPSAPSSMTQRYITEDVPYGLVPISEMGRLFGVPTPNTDAVISLCTAINQEDYRANGRTLSNLGLDGMGRKEVISCLLNGISLKPSVL
jgi:opine dehydrogenase